MKTLEYCIKRHGASLNEYEKAEIARKVELFRAKDVDGHSAENSAIEEILDELDLEVADVESQAEKQGWQKPAKEETAVVSKPEEAKKTRSPNDAKSFWDWNILMGGINQNDPGWKGELNDVRWQLKGGRKRPAMPPNMFNAKAPYLDERTAQAIEHGWLPEGSTPDDFYKALQSNPKTKYVAAGGETDIERQVQKELDRLKKEEQDLNAELEARHGTASVKELERRGIDTQKGKDRAAKEFAQEEGLSEEEVSSEIDRIFNTEAPGEKLLFQPAKEEFKLKPSEATPLERAALRGEKKAELPKGERPRAKIPEEKIPQATTGKQVSLLPQQPGETGEMFTEKPTVEELPKVEAKHSPQPEAKGKEPIDLLPLIKSLQPPGQDRALVSISELRDKAGMEPEAFDKALLQLSQEGKVALHQHDFPSSLTEAERSKLLSVENPKAHWGGRDYFVGVVPKAKAKANRNKSLVSLSRDLINSVGMRFLPKEYLTKEKRNYEIKAVKVADLKPTQEGEDLVNDSSKELARILREAKSVNDVPREQDLYPVLVDENLNIIDGNHRYAAATINNEDEILAFVPKGKAKTVSGPKAKKQAKGKPLSEITVNVPAIREATGEKIMVPSNAQEALADVNSRIDICDAMLKCLTGLS